MLQKVSVLPAQSISFLCISVAPFPRLVGVVAGVAEAAIRLDATLIGSPLGGSIIKERRREL